MNRRKKALSKVWVVAEVLYLAVVLYVLADTVILALRMGRVPSFQFVVTSLATIVPGGILVRGYLAYAQGREEGRRAILGCAAATAVLFGLSLVPRLKTLLFGLGDIPALQSLHIRILELTFGFLGSGRIFLFDLVAQAALPLLLLVLCEGRDLMGDGAPRSLGAALLRVVASVLVVWVAYAVTVWLINTDTFGHSWIIVGFIPIPGQIMLILPPFAALAGIVAIWSRR